MSLFSVAAILITATALLSYINSRFLGLPPAIGVMLGALCFSSALALVGWAGFGVAAWAESILESLDFDSLLLDGMLSFLLFAGALHVDLSDLLKRKWAILSLATVGVVISTLLTGSIFHLVTSSLGLEIPLPYAFLFGALISPTDPIAVLGILRGAAAPRTLQAKIVGESLFNDGVGVVIFSLLLGLAVEGRSLSLGHSAGLLAREAAGGAILGMILGYAAFKLLKSIDDRTVELLITLSTVTGGYVLAGAMHTSGPIAMVIAGLFIGNHGRLFGMSDRSRENLDVFWELVDEILNAVLFVLIGFEVLVLTPTITLVAASLATVPVVIAIRFVSVGIPISMLRLLREYGKRTVTLLTWAGLRGGISIALALSLPPSDAREVILFVTYAVVAFSILVQGLTVGRVLRWSQVRG